MTSPALMDRAFAVLDTEWRSLDDLASTLGRKPAYARSDLVALVEEGRAQSTYKAATTKTGGIRKIYFRRAET